MKKKLLPLLLAFAFGAGMCVQASVIASGTCGDNLTWEVTTTGYLDMYRALTISGMGEMTDFTVSNEAPWANYTSAMTSITLPEGLTTIGDRAFFYCSNVQEITIPSSVTRIGMQSFSRCDKLTNIDLPDGLEVIRNGAFFGARGLVSLTIPANVNHIGFGITNECLKLQSITVDKANTTFDSRNDCNAIIRTATNTLLAGCYNTIIPNTVDTIGIDALAHLPLPSIVIPEGVEEIENYAFDDCKPENLSLYIPASIKKIGLYTFKSNKFTSISVASGNEVFESPSGSNAIIEKATKTLAIGCPATVIPEGTLAIKEASFYDVNNLSSIVIPASVKNIYKMAFCFTGLTQLTCKASTPPTLEGSSVFYSVAKDIPVYVPKASVEAYKVAAGWDYFTNYIGIGEEEQTPEPCTESRQGTCGENLNWLITCDGELVITGSGAMTDFNYSNRAPWTAYSSEIKSVSLPDGLTHIGAWSIYQIPNIESVVIPEGVKSIGYVGFAGSRNLKSVTLPNSLETIGSMCFQATALQTLYIPANVASIGEGITEECEALLSIVVSEDNSTFDSREGCNAIIKTANNTLIAGCKTTIIPNTVTAIGNFAFSSNHNVEDVRIPNSVESIGDYAFQYCSGFKNLVIPTSVTYISGTAFTGCAFATIKVVPGNPKFDSRDNCNAIIETATKKLIKGSEFTVMPDGITAFGEGAFMSNRNLKFINIPATVESIEKNALIYCNNLKAITCLATVPPAAADLAFNYGAASSISIDPSIPVYVPGASIEAYKAAKNWNYFTNFVALDGYYTIKALATHGTVTGTGTYAANTTIELNAVPDAGYAFQQWTDGTTANPKELLVTKDETIRALFKMLDVEEEVAELSYQSDMMIITWDIIDKATIYIVNLYKGGVLLATYKTTDYVNFIELETYAPARMRARRNFADEQPGKISFSIEGLEYGADYSYSIDAYDADEEVVNVIAGSFNTAEIPTDASAVNSQANAPRKMLNDGKLFISMPDGKIYDATGVQRK